MSSSTVIRNNALQQVREEDFVEYFLFPGSSAVNGTADDEALENGDGDDDAESTSLGALLGEVNKLAQEFCQRYIWHRDGFKVVARKGGDRQQRLLIEATGQDEEVGAPLPSHLHGITHYGDNIQDEWIIVALLQHLTRRIPGLVARVVDSDGEFLLIEAADHLPGWANPERCEGRVFIFEGEVYLFGGDKEEEFPLDRVFRELRGENRTRYVGSKAIQSCIDERTREFPDHIEDSHHRTTLYVPVGVAAVLKENPQLISAAVLAFCNRDSVDLKACRAMRYFPPESCVYVSAVFTKCLYAMLLHNSYLPDRRTGWSLPLATDPNYKAHVLGVKLACGFEILASQARSAQGSLDTDKGWVSYFESLRSKGYFAENIEGSQEYTRLLGIAKDYYQENRDSMKFTPKIGEEIVSILKRNDYDPEELRKEGLDLPSPDDDSWINISPEELDQMLTKRYGVRTLLSLNGNATTPESFTAMMSEFLEQKSEFDGVDQDAAAQVDLVGTFKAPNKPKRTKSKSKADVVPNLNHVQPSPLHQPIDFDADAFGSTVKNLLDLVIPEDRWDSSDNSDMSDYGEEEYARNIEDMSPTRTGKAVQNEIQSYMDQMDRELAKTTIGKSFETEIAGEGDGEARKESQADDFDDIESFKPVNIDVNTLKNMMESYQAQIGGPGPAANLLGSMGVQVSRASGAKPGSTKQTDV